MKNSTDENENVINKDLFLDIKQIIDDSRNLLAQTVNSALSATYWHIGKRINDDILNNKRAEYGKQILSTLSAKLVVDYGSNFSVKSLHRMMQFNEYFPDSKIVATLWRQLSWSHFTKQIPKELLARKLHEFSETAKRLIENRNGENNEL